MTDFLYSYETNCICFQGCSRWYWYIFGVSCYLRKRRFETEIKNYSITQHQRSLHDWGTLLPFLLTYKLNIYVFIEQWGGTSHYRRLTWELTGWFFIVVSVFLAGINCKSFWYPALPYFPFLKFFYFSSNLSFSLMTQSAYSLLVVIWWVLLVEFNSHFSVDHWQKRFCRLWKLCCLFSFFLIEGLQIRCYWVHYIISCGSAKIDAVEHAFKRNGTMKLK